MNRLTIAAQRNPTSVVNPLSIPPLREGQTAAKMRVKTSYASRPELLRATSEVYEVNVGEELVVSRAPKPHQRSIERFLDHFPNVPSSWVSSEFLSLRLYETTVNIRIKYTYATPNPFVVRLGSEQLKAEYPRDFISLDPSFTSPNPIVLEIQEANGTRTARLTISAVPSDQPRVGTLTPIPNEAMLIRSAWALRQLKPGNWNTKVLADTLVWLEDSTVRRGSPTEHALANALERSLLEGGLYNKASLADRIRDMFEVLLVKVQTKQGVKTRRSSVRPREWNRALRRVGIAEIVEHELPLTELGDDEQIYGAPSTTLALVRLALIVRKYSILEPVEWERLSSKAGIK